MIRIIVSGGAVQEIMGIPSGMRVVVCDYDSAEDVDPAETPEGFERDDKDGLYELLVFAEGNND